MPATSTADWTPQTTPLCSRRCMRQAELLVDGEPYCITCADEWVERVEAVEISPRIHGLLPPLGGL